MKINRVSFFFIFCIIINTTRVVKMTNFFCMEILYIFIKAIKFLDTRVIFNKIY